MVPCKQCLKVRIGGSFLLHPVCGKRGTRNFTIEIIIIYSVGKYPPVRPAYNSRPRRLIQAQADRAERIIRTEAGDLVPAADVKPEWLDIVLTIRTRLLAIPARVAAAHPGNPAIITTLERELTSALSSIADKNRRKFPHARERLTLPKTLPQALLPPLSEFPRRS